MNRLLDAHGTGRRTGRLVVYLSIVSAVGLFAAVRMFSTGAFPDIPTILLYATLGMIGQHLQVTFSEGTFITVGDPMTFAALWCFGIPSSVLALVPASLTHFFTRKRGLMNCLFNAGQFTLSILAAGYTVDITRRIPWCQTSLGQILSVLSMILVFDAVNNSFVASAIAIDQELPLTDVFHRITFTERRNSLILWCFVNSAGVLLTAYMGKTGTLFVFIGILALWAQMQFERELARKSQEAQTDVLTGLLNVRYLEDWMAKEFPKISEKGENCSLVFVDVDGLKEINDSHGHDAGDALLVHLAGVLRAITRADDKAVRYGGDEFILICGKADLPEATGIGRRILDAVRRAPLVHEGISLTYGISLGIATFPKHTIAGRDLVRMADKAMYLAKKNGGNLVYTADSL